MLSVQMGPNGGGLDHSPLGQYGQLVVVKIVKRWHEKTDTTTSSLYWQRTRSMLFVHGHLLGRREQYAQNGIPAEVDQDDEAGGPLFCGSYRARDQEL